MQPLDLNKSEYIKELVLYHQTDLPSAEAIISTQTFKPSVAGCFGGGVYFANTIEAAQLKSARKGVFLVAEVSLGLLYPVHANNIFILGPYLQQIMNKGYKGIIGYGMPSGREIVVFDPKRIHNIKFCCGTVRPQAIFRTKKPRLTLFFATSSLIASQIVQTQTIPKINGTFGNACYLYDSITDAILITPVHETYLACFVKLKNYCKLKKQIDIAKLPHKYETFKGTIGIVSCFIIKNQKLITKIHYCGGKTW